MKSIDDLLEALEFARSQDAEVLHMDLIYGEETLENLGQLIDNAVAEWREEQDFQRKVENLREALRR